MIIEVNELLTCSFCLGPVYAGPINNLKESDSTLYYHQLNEDGSAEQDVRLYKRVNYAEVHPDNISLLYSIRETLKSKYPPLPENVEPD